MKTSPSRTRTAGLALAAVGIALSSSAFGQTRFATVRDDMTPVLSRTQFLSHADPNQVLHVNISLKPTDAAGLKAFVEDVSNPHSSHYRKFIAPKEVGARFGQPASVVRSVENYLQSEGFTIKLAAKSNLNIMADASVSQVERAFNTTINQYQTLNPRDPGRPMFFANAKPIQAPATIASKILTIGGLQNYSRPKPGLITINQAQTLYGIAKEFSAGQYGQGRTLAYSNFDGYRLSNLPLYYSAYSLPAPAAGVGSNVSIVTVDGGAGSGTANGEGDLDIQMILGMAPQCNLIIYDGSQSETDVLTQEQDDNRADVISESYGWGFSPADEDANHQIHLMMSAQGITYMCASGDDGTSYLNEDQAVYPDIDPDVLVVGGTIATTDSIGNRISEVAWPQGAGGYTNDGAQCNATPSYQKLGTPGIPTGIPYRLLPDVAVNAGGAGSSGSAFPFYWNGALVTYGSGTSFSSPLFAGGLGMAEQELISLGKLSADADGHYRFGRIADLFYSQNLRPDVWYDITSGSNGTLLNGDPSTAGVGWDTATGLGAINFNGFVNSFGLTVGLKVSPTTVLAGANSTGTVSVSTPAGASGDVVSLSTSDPTYVTVPSSVTIPSGATTATFSIATHTNSANYTSTITATCSGASGTATLTVDVDSISGLSLNPTTVNGGQSSTGTVQLAAPAPPGGWIVSLASNNTSVANVPSTVTVPGGASSTTFTVSSNASAETYEAVITALDSLTNAHATLTVLASTISNLSLNPTSVFGGSSSTGTVTLSGPAGASGIVISLSSSSASATVPGSVTVPSGATTATFAVGTSAVSSSVTATIAATMGGSSKSASLAINPMTLGGLTVSPSAVVGGLSSAGTVSLNGTAPAGGVTIKLSSSSTSASTPATVTIVAGATSATFTITTTAVSSNLAATISAALGTNTKTATLTIEPSLLGGVSISPTSVTGGNSATGNVTLLRAAPAGGASISLSSNSAFATVPTALMVPAGATTANFTVTTYGVANALSATIIAGYGGSTKSATLTILPATLASIVIAPGSVVGGASATGTVTLGGPAPTGGVTIGLVCSSLSATVPTSIFFAAGSATAAFPISTKAVASMLTATVTASLGSASRSATLTLLPSAIQSLSLSPSTVVGGSSTTVIGTVTFSAPAPAAGDTVTLTSSNPKLALVPASVKVLSGAVSAPFTVTHFPVTSTQTVNITANYGGVIKTAVLTLSPFQLSAFTISPSSVTGGNSAVGEVTLNAAPGLNSGAVVVKLTSTSKAVQFPASLSFAMGQLTGSFTITTSAEPLGLVATIVATLGSGSLQAGLVINPPTLLSVSVSPNSFKGSSSTAVIGTVSLTGPSPAGGMIITLKSSDPSAASVPASVTVPAGKSSATFKVGHSKVTLATIVMITATQKAASKGVTITVTP